MYTDRAIMRLRGARRPIAWIRAAWVGLTIGAAWGAAPSTRPAERELDESAFREGLRLRGLDDWLEQYLADSPPVSDVDERLRQRERLLAEAALAGRDECRRKVGQASAILTDLIQRFPQHPFRGPWRLELARDDLERLDPTAFDAVLLYELPGSARSEVSQAVERAARTLDQLRGEVAAEWKTLEALDERRLAEAVASGVTRQLERIDAQSAFLRAWAEFYLALSSPDSEAHRQARLTELLEAITRRYGWTAPQPGHEVQRCSALLMAAVASRLTGQPVEARQYAREVQEAVSQVKDPLARGGLGKIVLLAVLEQIRSPRDAGRLDEAQATLDEARAWVRQARPGDLTAELALAFLERSIMVRRLAAGGQPVEPQGLISPSDALSPLQRAASLSPQARDALYELLSGTSVPAEDPLGGGHSPFAVQLICGSALAAGRAASPAPRSERLGQVAIGLTQALRAPTPPGPEAQGELMFLLARAHFLSDAPLEAARVLCELVEKLPAHDRAGSAAEQAVALAQEALRREGPGRESARAVFVQAGRLLCRHWPTSPTARLLPFFIAAALDEGRQYAEAAEAYAAVPPDDPRALRAAWGQARCLREALNLAPATRPADLPAARSLAVKALAAARSAEQLARSTPDAEPCLAADITLTLAGLLDHPLIARPEEAIQTLEGFERRHAGCPAATATMLRERVSAYRQLKRMAEARAVMEQVLAADPDNAGPMMARLLEAMREEMESAGERGDAAQRRSIAREAALLAERLERWADEHPGRLSAAETRTVAVWRAWATQEAGRPDEALELYDRAVRLGPQTRPEDRPQDAEIRLGKAECLLEVGKPSEALPLLAAALQQAPEDSPLWWRAFTGTLRAHTALDHDRAQIVQAVRQQRRLHPAMGGPRWKRELEQLERENAPPAEAPAPERR